MIGKYSHRVTIQQPTVTRGDRGAEVVTWSTFATMYANIRTVSASERQALGEQPIGSLAHQVETRYKAGIRPTMRLIWGDRYFAIEGVAEPDNRRKRLVLYCQELTASGGVAQVETATAAGTITLAGNATVVVTSAVVTGSPLTLSVAVALGDTAAVWAGKVRAALQAEPAITDRYAVGGAADQISLTALVKAANDSTLNISLANGTCTGITAAPASANTTAGVAPTPADVR